MKQKTLQVKQLIKKKPSFINYKLYFLSSTSYGTDDTDLDPTFNLSVEDSYSDGSDSTFLTNEGNIDNEQNNSNYGESDEQDCN